MDKLKDVTTKDLVEELSGREGVEATHVSPYEVQKVSFDVNGPMIILRIID